MDPLRPRYQRYIDVALCVVLSISFVAIWTYIITGCGGPQTVEEVVQFDSANVHVAQIDESTEVSVAAQVTLVESVQVPLAVGILILDDDIACLLITLDDIRYAPPIESLADPRCTRWIAGRPMSKPVWKPVVTDTTELLSDLAAWLVRAIF